jgi:hypothetical protein
MVRRCVYIYFDRRGSVIYVGRTCRGRRRVEEHRAEEWWWPMVDGSKVVHVPDTHMERCLEGLLIQVYRPLGNKCQPGNEETDLEAHVWLVEEDLEKNLPRQTELERYRRRVTPEHRDQLVEAAARRELREAQALVATLASLLETQKELDPDADLTDWLRNLKLAEELAEERARAVPVALANRATIPGGHAPAIRSVLPIH